MCAPNPAASQFCNTCGHHIHTAEGRVFRERPKQLSTIAVFGLLTAIPSLYWNGLTGIAAGASTSFRVFSIAFALLGIPLNLMLGAASVGLLLPPKQWARRLMGWWCAAIVVYESVQLVLATLWIAPHVTGAELGETEIDQLGNGWTSSAFVIEYAVYWISMISLAAWAWWVLRRPEARDYFEASDADAKPPLS